MTTIVDTLAATSLPVAAWLGTYLVHSTLLIGLVWLLARLPRAISPATRDAMWKAALVGGVLTASLQAASGVQPPWQAQVSSGRVDTRDVRVADLAAPAQQGASVAAYFGEYQAHAAFAPVALSERQVQLSSASAAPTNVQPHVLLLVLGLVGLGMLAALGRLLGTVRRLRRQLKGRRDVLEDPLLETFLGLCQRAGVRRRVRLTAVEGIGSPVALWGREVCLPERAVEGLDPRQQESMLAHELAHVLRRDPWWLALAAIVEAVFFFQPLNRLARLHMQETAELLCDDFAVRMTGSGVHLAKCLAEVATWLDDGGVPLASAMAGAESSLVVRIKRLLHARRGPATSAPRRTGAVIALFAVVVLAAPAVSVAHPSNDHPQTHTAATHQVYVSNGDEAVVIPYAYSWSHSSEASCDDEEPGSRNEHLARRKAKATRRRARRRGVGSPPAVVVIPDRAHTEALQAMARAQMHAAKARDDARTMAMEIRAQHHAVRAQALSRSQRELRHNTRELEQALDAAVARGQLTAEQRDRTLEQVRTVLEQPRAMAPMPPRPPDAPRPPKAETRKKAKKLMRPRPPQPPPVPGVAPTPPAAPPPPVQGSSYFPL